MVCGGCRRVGCPTKRTLSIFSSNFLPHISDLVAKMVARMISENLWGGREDRIKTNEQSESQNSARVDLKIQFPFNEYKLIG